MSGIKLHTLEGPPDPSRPPISLTFGRNDAGEMKADLVITEGSPLGAACYLLAVAHDIVHEFTVAVLTRGDAHPADIRRLTAYVHTLEYIAHDLGETAHRENDTPPPSGG